MENVFTTCSSVRGTLSIWGGRRSGKMLLFWKCHVWPQREVWARKVILYRDTQEELLLSCVRQTELDWSTLEVPANHVHTHLGGMWTIVPVNREDVSKWVAMSVQDIGSGCLLYVCVFVFACVFGDRAAQISLNGWHRYRILFPLLRSAMESHGNHVRW